MRKGKSYTKKHSKIVNDFDKTKEKHLEKLATQILEREEKMNKLKSKLMKGNFLNKF